jgi:hypothetical protein
MLNPNTVTLETLRPASDPYTIEFNNKHYMLSEDDLKSHVELKMQRKRDWYFSKLTLLSFEAGLVKLQNTHKNTSFVMTLGIEPDRVHISCSCGLEVKSICLHSYKALQSMMRFDGYCSFGIYRPNGLLDLAMKYPKHFDEKDFLNEMRFYPKDTLGNVYKLTAFPAAGLEFSDVYHHIITKGTRSTCFKSLSGKHD